MGQIQVDRVHYDCWTFSIFEEYHSRIKVDQVIKANSKQNLCTETNLPKRTPI